MRAADAAGAALAGGPHPPAPPQPADLPPDQVRRPHSLKGVAVRLCVLCCWLACMVGTAALAAVAAAQTPPPTPLTHLFSPSLPPPPPSLRSELAVLQQLQQLEEVDVGWCSGVEDSDASVLANLPHLQTLNLARTQVGGLAVAAHLPAVHLPAIARLDLDKRGPNQKPIRKGRCFDAYTTPTPPCRSATRDLPACMC